MTNHLTDSEELLRSTGHIPGFGEIFVNSVVTKASPSILGETYYRIVFEGEPGAEATSLIRQVANSFDRFVEVSQKDGPTSLMCRVRLDGLDPLADEVSAQFLYEVASDFLHAIQRAAQESALKSVEDVTHEPPPRPRKQPGEKRSRSRKRRRYTNRPPGMRK